MKLFIVPALVSFYLVMVNGAPQYSPESQMRSVFDILAKMNFNYIDYNALMGNGSQCKPLLVDGTLSIIKEADEEAAKCRSADDPNKCYDDVAFRIDRRYRAQRTQVIICAQLAGISVKNDAVAAIQDSLTEHTISVVMSVFKKRTEANSTEEKIDDDNESRDTGPEDTESEESESEDTKSEDTKSEDTKSEDTKSEDTESKNYEPEDTRSQEEDTEPENPKFIKNESAAGEQIN